MHIYHFNSVALSALTTNLYYGLLIGGLPAGIIVDRYGAGKVSVVSSMLVVLGAFLFSWSKTETEFEIAQFLLGLGFSTWFPVCQKIIVQSYSSDRIPLFSGLCMASFTVGSALSIAGIIDLVASIGFFDTKTLMVVLCVILFILLLMFYKVNDGEKSSESSSIKTLLLQQLQILKLNHYLIIVLCNTLLSAYTAIFLALWALPYLKSLLVHDPAISGNIVSITFLMVSLSAVLFGNLYYKYLSPLGWLLLQCVCVLLGFSCLLFFPPAWLNMWVVVFLFLFCGVFVGGNLTFTVTYTLSLFPSDLSGSVSSLFSTLSRAFFALLMPLIGWELYYLDKTGKDYTLSDYDTSFLTIFAMYGLSAFIMLIVKLTYKGRKPDSK